MRGRWIAIAPAAVLMSAAISQAAAPSAPRPLPDNPADSYAAAVDFAKCSASWEFASEIAKGHDLKETATAFADTARGWRIAGWFLLAESMTPDAMPHTQETFDNLVNAHLQTLKAKRELQGDEAGPEMVGDINRICTPWAGTQEGIIGAMRRSLPVTPEDQ